MAILLPSQPSTTDGTRMRYIDFGAELGGALGGSVQKHNRLGNRHALDVVLPMMPAEPTGRVFVSRLKRAKTEGALYPVPQDGLVIGNPGAPLVNGAGAAGKTLPVKGFTAEYPVREGQFFSLIHAGRRYVHSVDAALTAGVDGTTILTITPMLRIAPSNNDVLEFAQPLIEGWVSGNEVGWDVNLVPYLGLAFTIAEAE